jgi:L-ascorbate metabolism protein UlaG (beta-lactamase superfamily)
MRVTKFGHSCFLVEESKAKILFDPGDFSESQNSVIDIDAVLVTHEHPDHFSPESLRTILKNNPTAKIFTNQGTGSALSSEKFSYMRIGDGESTEIKGTTIRGEGVEHAIIHPEITRIKNTGYLIADRLYYPGDALYVPKVSVEILALPVAAPWLKISEAIEYALAVKPRVVFPVHDGMLHPDRLGATRYATKIVFESHGIEFHDAIEGSIIEF